MECCLVKTGAEMFDMLHAYGLGILLAHASGKSVELSDGAAVYTLICPLQSIPHASVDILDDVLVLPKPEDVQTQEEARRGASVAIANLDGLLALLFTSPGIRAASLADVERKSQYDASAAEQAIKKVHIARARWKARMQQQFRGMANWLENLLQDYDPAHPAIPAPSNVARGRELSLIMTIDPAFSFSTRRPRSDGLVTQKTNVTIRGTSFAVLLAYIGAARFLRTMSVKGNLVTFIVPVAASLTLVAGTSLPPLASAAMYTQEQAIALRWLEYAQQTSESTQWRGLAYQTVQTQGAQQSIPRSRGFLDFSSCARMKRPVREALLRFWQRLSSSQDQRPACDIDNLLDWLGTRHANSWLSHLHEVARWVHHPVSGTVVRQYSLEEVKEVIAFMSSSTPSKLAAILERKVGTLRIGHALRLLARVNPAEVRDLVEELETVQTIDQLLLKLAQIAQDCQIAVAKSPFILVPDDDDLKYLLEDVEQAGVQTIARFLVILSALRYPRLEESESDAQELKSLIFLLLATLRMHHSQTAGEDGGYAVSDSDEGEIPAPHVVPSLQPDGEQP